MNKTNINRLKRAMKNCFDNAEMLLDGGADYPKYEEIVRAEKFINVGLLLNNIIKKDLYQLWLNDKLQTLSTIPISKSNCIAEETLPFD